MEHVAYLAVKNVAFDKLLQGGCIDVDPVLRDDSHGKIDVGIRMRSASEGN